MSDVQPSTLAPELGEGTPVGRLKATPLPVPGDEPPKSAIGRWMFTGTSAGGHEHPVKPWTSVLWLTGVDYFSTLGYQPGIALLAAGALSPLATALLVLVTLLGALPVYAQVAKRSYIGQGSIAMLERLLPGWSSKVMVLVLLGFASTDFVITMTLSAADAAKHLVENPYFEPVIGHHEILFTLVLLALLTAVFLKGFHEAVGLAVAVGVPYLLLNVVVSIRALVEVAQHPSVWDQWQGALHARGDWTALLVLSALTFPKLALGLSGFETGVSVMPNVKGDATSDLPKQVPVGRIRNTQKLLLSAALIMSVMLLASSFVTTLLIPEEAYADGGKASGRALAYLAHDLLGPVFGTIYDVSTIAILWFAGASAMAALLNLIPRYLPRFGMAPRWVSLPRALVLVIFVIDVLVTLVFRADVEAQGGAYATGVLVLILSAAVAVSITLWREGATEPGARGKSIYFWCVAALFAYTLVDNVIERPDGVIIASIFTTIIVLVSAISRWRRATEFRVERLVFDDALSAALWQQIIGKKVNLVPTKSFDEHELVQKAAELRRYNVEGKFAFLHVELRDDRSEFNVDHRVVVKNVGDHYQITIHGAVTIANVIAYVSELIDPLTVFLGLTRAAPMSQAVKYVLWGEGETGILVYHILLRYWDWTPEEDVRPTIILISD